MMLSIPRQRGLCAAWLCLAGSALAQAAGSPGTTEDWSLHGQFTSVTQRQAAFRSPYEGDNSLPAQRSQKETADITLYLGTRLWRGAELYLNPEIDHGFGLGNTLGVAGFPSGEAYKVGKNTPYLRLNRLFVRQVIALGDAQEAVAPAANTLAGMAPQDNVTITVGKFSVADLFDDNAYAHDPRVDFLNWSIIDAGAFDYAADAWGFTRGAAVEWTQGDWTVRGGLFALSTHPNSAQIDTGFSQHAWIGELEHRHTFGGLAGSARLLWFVNHGRMARYDDATALAATNGSTPDLEAVRRRGSKSGWALNVDQALTADVGGFLRYSASDGRQEAFDFTEINRSLSGGVSVKGAAWGAPTHTLGLGMALNGISAQARRYFAAGGMGILIGDGQLPHYGRERIIEAYYSAPVMQGVRVGVDLQHIANPAYNRDRGPVRIAGLRLHAEF